jgi:hypothetical protein
LAAADSDNPFVLESPAPRGALSYWTS